MRTVLWNRDIDVQRYKKAKRFTCTKTSRLMDVVEDSADAHVTRGMHDVKGIVNLVDRHAIGDILVQPEISLKMALDELRDLSATLDSSKSTSHPDASSDELERSSLNERSSRSNSNDDRLTPALVTSLESNAHQFRASNTLEGAVNENKWERVRQGLIPKSEIEQGKKSS